MKNFFLITWILLIIPVESCDNAVPEEPGIRIMFWNTENCFDYIDDPDKEDDEFLPQGIRRWTKDRYKRKLINISKTIIAAGAPEMIGLCEIENERVILDMLNDTPLKYHGYKFIHHDSPDRRGIDVAFLYDPLEVKVIDEYPVSLSENIKENVSSRDILYVRVLVRTTDTVSLYINHWPSKYGGTGLTEHLRFNAAIELKSNVEETMRDRPYEMVVLTGDFNDPPESLSMSVHLGAETGSKNGFLYNISTNDKFPPGTYKYQGIWEMIDQFCINEMILTKREFSFRIYAPDFLLEEDKTSGGLKPFRTYNGMIYNGGFSDHLPIILDMP